MILDSREFLLRAGLGTELLEVWVEAGWLAPGLHGDAWQFSEIDLARAQLVQDLRQDLGVNEEGIPIILDLVDQVCGLRRTLGNFLSALRAQAQPSGH